MVYARAPIDEEDQDSFLLQLDQDVESRLWEAHALACLILFKADTLDAFKKGIEMVDDIELSMTEFYEKWEADNVMPEYRFGALNSFAQYLWEKLCDIAPYCKEEIEERYNERAENDYKTHTNEQHVFSTFFEAASNYADDFSDADDRYMAATSMLAKYNFLSRAIQQAG